MDIAFVAQFFEQRVWQLPVAIQTPLQRRLGLSDRIYRAFDIHRRLFNAVVHEPLVDLLAWLPRTRDAAILWMQRAQVQRSTVERDPCRRYPFAEPAEKGVVVGQEPAFPRQPVGQFARVLKST